MSTKIGKIKALTDREHILHRPSMYIGGVSVDAVEDFVLEESTLSRKILNYAPGLVKIINEVLDNSVDAIIKTGVGNKIEVSNSDGCWVVSDNSSGFPIKSESDSMEPLVLALGHARAGSNFEDETNVGQMGTNGVGAFATNCFSLVFKATTVTKQGSEFRKVVATWRNNAVFDDVKESTIKNGSSGTTVEFLPDYAKFGGLEQLLAAELAISTRLHLLAYTYPKIRFSFNGVKIEAPKNITEWFNIGEDPQVNLKTDKYEIHVVARSSEFQNFSFMNGLNIKDGGSHIDAIAGDISREFGSMRGLTTNKADILNTIQIMFVGNQFKNLRFNSQTKEKITNSAAEVREYLGDISSFITKVGKNKAFKDFIKATQSAREHRANKAQLDKAKKAKIKSDKFLDAQGNRVNLMLVEGDSALGGLVPALGRREIAYYALKGKPLNAYSASNQKLTANKELTELLSIIHNSDFQRVIIGTDQDLDGFHIRGLLLGFFWKYLPEMLDRIYFLQTPVRGVTKSGKLLRWSFNLNEDLEIKSGERSQYYKGLGSWDREDLQQVVKAEGLESLMQKVEVSGDPAAPGMLDAWLGDDSQKRKDLIMMNDFEIAKA